MRPSNKPRSRGKSGNRRNNVGSILNRVFDSSGPDGKVRGTPQQIIDKYNALARDAQLAGDRIGAENHLQHSEHYARLLGEAQREIAGRREAMESNRQQAAQASADAQPRQQTDNSDSHAVSEASAPEEHHTPGAGTRSPAPGTDNGRGDGRRPRGRPARRNSGANRPQPGPADESPDPVIVAAKPESDDASSDAVI